MSSVLVDYSIYFNIDLSIVNDLEREAIAFVVHESVAMVRLFADWLAEEMSCPQETVLGVIGQFEDELEQQALYFMAITKLFLRDGRVDNVIIRSSTTSDWRAS